MNKVPLEENWLNVSEEKQFTTRYLLTISTKGHSMQPHMIAFVYFILNLGRKSRCFHGYPPQKANWHYTLSNTWKYCVCFIQLNVQNVFLKTMWKKYNYINVYLTLKPLSSQTFLQSDSLCLTGQSETRPFCLLQKLCVFLITSTWT